MARDQFYSSLSSVIQTLLGVSSTVTVYERDLGSWSTPSQNLNGALKKIPQKLLI